MTTGFIRWPSIAWTVAWLAFPFLSQWLRRSLADRAESQVWLFDEITPWVFGLAPAYLAWTLGLLPGRMIGFLGRGGLLGWVLIGLLLAGLLTIYWRWFLPRLTLDPLDIRPDHALLDEPRWAFFRGVVWLWIGDFWWGTLAGFGLSLLEWGVIHKTWRIEQRANPQVCFHLARRATSTLAFALSANLWLTMVFQAGLIWTIYDPEVQTESRA